MTLVRAANLTRRFGAFTAVDAVDLDVGGGEVVGLLGANGAGKTTVIRMLLGLLGPSAGAIELFGEPPSRRTRRRIGYVPQFGGLYDDLTVTENLAFAAAAFGVSGGARLDGDLGAVRDRVIEHISLGLKRRAAFAMALDHRPDLLVLDEPTSGVDPLGRARIWETVRDAADTGCGVLVSTHYMDEARQCDRLLLMAAGRVVAAGSVDEIVGATTAVEVRTGEWEGAFEALDAATLPVSLVGTVVRVPATGEARVRDVLAAAGVVAELATVPATLEETMVLVAEGTPAGSVADGDPSGEPRTGLGE